MSRAIASTRELYAHALAMEREAVRRYREYEAYFDARGDEVLAGLCRNLATLEAQHLAAIGESARGIELPLEDASGDGPIASSLEGDGAFRDAVDARQLLEIALRAECDALGFFEWVASTSPDETVRSLAQEMALEEMDHVKWVRDAIEYHEPSGLQVSAQE